MGESLERKTEIVLDIGLPKDTLFATVQATGRYDRARPVKLALQKTGICQQFVQVLVVRRAGIMLVNNDLSKKLHAVNSLLTQDIRTQSICNMEIFT